MHIHSYVHTVPGWGWQVWPLVWPLTCSHPPLQYHIHHQPHHHGYVYEAYTWTLLTPGNQNDNVVTACATKLQCMHYTCICACTCAYNTPAHVHVHVLQLIYIYHWLILGLVSSQDKNIICKGQLCSLWSDKNWWWFTDWNPANKTQLLRISFKNEVLRFKFCRFLPLIVITKLNRGGIATSVHYTWFSSSLRERLMSSTYRLRWPVKRWDLRRVFWENGGRVHYTQYCLY